MGTLNHFARDLGIHSLAEAERVLAEGHVREIDAGMVNGRLFLNNSGIGIYPAIVLSAKRCASAAFPVARVPDCVRSVYLQAAVSATAYRIGRHSSGARHAFPVRRE